jgi:hypothetical protein
MVTKKATAFALICLCALIAVSISSVNAQTIGVAKGNKFTSEFEVHGTHTDGVYWAVWMPDENQSDWIVTVTSTSSQQVSTQLQVIYANGTAEEPSTMIINMNDGSCSSVSNYLFIVNSDLNVGGTLYPTGLAYPVDQVVSRAYGNGQRNTIHFGIPSAGETIDAYSDQQTGALVQLTDTYYDGSGYAELTLIDSNVWSVQGASPLTSLTRFSSTSTTPSPETTATPTPTAPEIPPTFITPILIIAVFIGTTVTYKLNKNKQKPKAHTNH